MPPFAPRARPRGRRPTAAPPRRSPLRDRVPGSRPDPPFAPRGRRAPLAGWIALLLLAFGGTAAAEWSIDLATGSAVKATTSLTVEQEGHPRTVIGAVRYETRPWNTFNSLTGLTENYYSLRVGYFFERDDLPPGAGFGVEGELLHDKIYYLAGDDPDGVVQHFELSDGVNYLLLNAALRHPLWPDDHLPRGRLQLLARAGAGAVITKPATTIRGLERGHDIQGTTSGYELSGVGVQLAGQAKLFHTPWLASSLELKATYAAPRSSIAGGWTRTPLWTLHLTFGVSFTP